MNRGHQILTISKRILAFGSQYVTKQHLELRCHQGIYFPNQVLSEWWKNKMKVLPCKFYKCLGLFNMLTVKGRIETVFLESGLTKSLTVCTFERKVAMTIIFFFSKCSKINVVFRNRTKKSEKVFCFQDNCIWAGLNKFSYSWTRYLSLAVNKLPSNPNI